MNILQIGVANADDHVKKFVYGQNKNDIFLYLVEPNVNSNNFIESTYSHFPHMKIFNNAISTYDGEIEMYFFDYESGNTQAASVSKHHVERHNVENLPIVSHKINCYSLNTFLEKIVGVKQIHYLFMDTEGHDCDIILSTDFSRVDIHNITFEYLHADGPFSNSPFKNDGINFPKTKQYLIDNGYIECHNDINEGNITFCKI